MSVLLLYDSFGQLTREENEQCKKIINYTYDSIGNIISAETCSYPDEASISTDTYVYSESEPDVLVSFNSKAITYNSDGCVATYDGWNYSWTNGRLSYLSKGSIRPIGSPNQSYSFTYNGRGQRTSKTYSNFPGLVTQIDYLRSCTTNYTYDIKGRLISETRTSSYSDNTSIVRKFDYLYEDTEIVGIIYTFDGTSGVYYYDKNHKGDVIAILDNSGNAVVKYKYDAYGNCSYLGSTNMNLAESNPIRYRSYYFDEDTGLYYLNARYYNPEWRRFISPDNTAYLDPDSVNGLNLYAYCLNDPVNYCDPSGHLAFFIFTAIIGGALGLGITAAVDYGPDQEFNLHWGWYVGAGVLGAAIGAGIGMAVSYYTTGSIASSTGKVLTSLFKSTSLYRSVGPDELADVRATGKFRDGPNSMEGKYFAKSKKGALEWGKSFKQSDYVKIRVPKSSLSHDTILKIKYLDAIDDAFYFSDLEFLNLMVEHIWFL